MNPSAPMGTSFFSCCGSYRTLSIILNRNEYVSTPVSSGCGLTLRCRQGDGSSWTARIAYAQLEDLARTLRVAQYAQLEDLALALRVAQQESTDLDDLFVDGTADADVDLLDQLDDLEATEAALPAE